MWLHKKSGGATTDSGIVIGGAKPAAKLSTKRLIFILATVVLVAAAGVGTFLLVRQHSRTVALAKARTAKQLKAVNSPINYAIDPAALKASSSGVIANPSGVSNAQLAMAYSSRGSSESNLKEYAAAASDYEKAVQLDPSLALSVDYNEFYVRYKNGERKTLIPLLQNLVKLENAVKNDDYAPANAATYQQYIDDLQAGKDLNV